jgi:hypothetical protein
MARSWEIGCGCLLRPAGHRRELPESRDRRGATPKFLSVTASMTRELARVLGLRKIDQAFVVTDRIRTHHSRK